MRLHPQDLLVLLKLAVHPEEPFTQAELARSLGMSLSEVSQALRRTVSARLAVKAETGVRPSPPALAEFVIHGLRYAFPAELGPLTRGIPTAWAAPPLAEEFMISEGDSPPVWPDATGSTRGAALEPLYRSAPKAALMDPALYGILALVDALRVGRARERESAARHLRARIQGA